MAQPQLNLIRMYTKGISLEQPSAPNAFFENEGAPLQDTLDLQQTINHGSNGVAEVALRATLTFKVEGKVVFVLEAEQAGVFQLSDAAQEDVERLLTVVAAPMVYSHLKVRVGDMMTWATVPSVHLPELNWVEQYDLRVAQKAAA